MDVEFKAYGLKTAVWGLRFLGVLELRRMGGSDGGLVLVGRGWADNG